MTIGLPGIREGSVGWGDYDTDGDIKAMASSSK